MNEADLIIYIVGSEEELNELNATECHIGRDSYDYDFTKMKLDENIFRKKRNIIFSQKPPSIFSIQFSSKTDSKHRNPCFKEENGNSQRDQHSDQVTTPLMNNNDSKIDITYLPQENKKLIMSILDMNMNTMSKSNDSLKSSQSIYYKLNRFLTMYKMNSSLNKIFQRGLDNDNESGQCQKAESSPTIILGNWEDLILSSN